MYLPIHTLIVPSRECQEISISLNETNIIVYRTIGMLRLRNTNINWEPLGFKNLFQVEGWGKIDTNP